MASNCVRERLLQHKRSVHIQKFKNKNNEVALRVDRQIYERKVGWYIWMYLWIQESQQFDGY